MSQESSAAGSLGLSFHSFVEGREMPKLRLIPVSPQRALEATVSGGGKCENLGIPIRGPFKR